MPRPAPRAEASAYRRLMSSRFRVPPVNPLRRYVEHRADDERGEIPMGTSRWGFFASAAWVYPESKPIYAKKSRRAASMPSGASGSVWPTIVWPKRILPETVGANCFQLSGLRRTRPPITRYGHHLIPT